MAENSSCQSCGKPVDPPDRFCSDCDPDRTEPGPAPSASERMTTDRLVEATKGEFKILRQVGHGAMGSVYLARDIALSRRVAIKVISPHLLQDEVGVSRFLLEAKTVAALNHPHIVTLHAVRQLGGLYYFVMDFIDGPSLRYVMEKKGPMDLPLVQALLYQVGGALTYAHRRGVGVIHRDVKPANIMIDREGNAVVTDFGIAKIGAAQTGLTQDGSTVGTPAYMSPEQCRGKELTGASDQYALGVVAYEMLAGVQPFQGEMMAVMMAHTQEEPPSLREHRPDCPAMVEAAIFRMMAKAPEDRFPHVAAAVAALGGRPFEHDDPIREATVSLVRSLSGREAGLDYDSPLSPLPGAVPAADATPPEAAETLVLPAREEASEQPTDVPGAAAKPSKDDVPADEDLKLVTLVEESSVQAVVDPPDAPASDGPAQDKEPAAAVAMADRFASAEQSGKHYSTAWVAATLREGKSPRRRLRWRLWLGAAVVLAVGLSPPVRARWMSMLPGLGALSGVGASSAGSGASVGLAAATDTLETGDTLQLEATILAGGVFQSDTLATWETSDAAVATVDRVGLVRARAPGVAEITVTFQDASASTEIVVRRGR